MIMDYNRVVKDLGAYNEDTFLEKVKEIFSVRRTFRCEKAGRKGKDHDVSCR